MAANTQAGNPLPPENDPNAFRMAAPSQDGVPVEQRAPRKSVFTHFIRSFDELESGQQPRESLKKELKSFHSQLIALGSAIGTGLFIGSGQGLAVAGPIPLLAAFAFVGVALCPTIFALGEMATLYPLPGGFFGHCRMYTDEAWGGAMGWNYVFQWLVALPLELVAATITIQYWGTPLHYRFPWVMIFLFGLTIINVFGVKGWGNVEAAFSLMKVAAILGFIMFGILRDLGLGFHGDALGVQHWYNPGATQNGWVGFCSVLVTAAFAYSGSEMVGLTAEEQENPKRDMPRAIKQVFFRIGIFYILSIFLVGLLVPFNDHGLIKDEGSLTSAASPFVLALKNSGAAGLAHVVNGVILVTVLSVANASVYGSSRVLNAMAQPEVGLAPACFAYVDQAGRPLRCFYLSATFGLLAFLAELSDQSTVFIWLVSLCGLSSIISWSSICLTHIRFRKALKIHNKALTTLPYESPLGVFGSWVGLLCNLFIIMCQLVTAVWPVDYHSMTAAQRAQHAFQSAMAFPLVGIVYLGFKNYKGTHVDDNGAIVWGPGTTSVDLLKDVDFEGSWNEGDYVEWARMNPNLFVKIEPLWWCPKFLRGCITFFDFPWRSRGEKELADIDQDVKRRIEVEEAEAEARIAEGIMRQRAREEWDMDMWEMRNDLERREQEMREWERSRFTEHEQE